MSAATYQTTTRSGDRIQTIFAPTLGKFRGEAWGRWGHGVCRHEHDTPDAAERCARAMARRIAEASK
jgi:hypothetical protein